MDLEMELYSDNVTSYGLYEDLYKASTFSVEDAYEEYWEEKE